MPGTDTITYLNSIVWDKKVKVFAADSFKVTVKWMLGQGNWPKYTDSASLPKHLVSIDSNIYMVSDRGFIYGFSYSGDTVLTDSALADSLWHSLTSPSVLDSHLVFASKQGSDSAAQAIHRYCVNDMTDTVLLTLQNDSLSTLITVNADTLMFGTHGGRLHKALLGFDTSVVLDSLAPVQVIGVDAEQIFAVCNGKLFKVSGQSLKILDKVSIPGLSGSTIRLVMGDIIRNKAGHEIVLNDNSGNVVLLDSTLTLQAGWPVKIEATRALSPALGDIDNDGLLDIIIPGNNKIFCLSYTGTHLSNWPHIVAKREPVGQFTAPVSLADIDGNGDMEVFVVAPNSNILIIDGDSRYYEFTAGAKVMNRALSFGGDPGLSCVVKNIDTDKASNVPEHMEIFTLNKAGYISCFNIPVKDGFMSVWETEGGSLQRTYVYQDSLLPTFKGFARDISVDTLFTYPNPTKVDNITLKYKLSKPAGKVTLKLFNVAGNLILKKNGLPANALWNHYPLSVKRYAPGMYMLKLEASADDGDAFRFTKVGILK
jgi:hypothetical protein